MLLRSGTLTICLQCEETKQYDLSPTISQVVTIVWIDTHQRDCRENVIDHYAHPVYAP